MWLVRIILFWEGVRVGVGIQHVGTAAGGGDLQVQEVALARCWRTGIRWGNGVLLFALSQS